MGLRSWITTVSTAKEFKDLRRAIKKNDVAYGVHYVALMKPGVPRLGGKMIVAWSGDGQYSLEQMSGPVKARTLLLDNLSAKPGKGNIAKSFKDDVAVLRFFRGK